MKAVLARCFGAPDEFAVETLPDLQPSAGEVRIRARVAAVSFVDSLTAAGRYQVRPTLPFVPGSEVGGVIDQIGAGVRGLRIGDHVVGSIQFGAFAELVIVPVHHLMRIDPAMEFDQTVAAYIPQLTALYALTDRGKLRRGQTVLVLGAGGAIGFAALQIATLMGARVIAAASSPEKREAALAAGAIAAIDSRSTDFRSEVATACGGKVDMVVDPVGGALTETAFRCLNWRGRLLVIGFASGKIAQLPVNLALLKGAALIGVNVGQYLDRQPRAAAALRKQLHRWWEQGELATPIRCREPLSRFAPAMVAAADGMGHGRVLLDLTN